MGVAKKSRSSSFQFYDQLTYYSLTEISCATYCQLVNMELKNPANEHNEKKFKSFNDTYAFCAFGLAVGLMYPNKTNIRKRTIIALLILGVNLAELFWFVAYIIKCVERRDIYNFMRNMSLVVITTLFFFKSFYVNWKNDEFAELLNKMSSDLVKANDFEEDYQKIYEYYIKQGKIGQTVWIIIPIIFSVQFPIYASIGTIYESLKSDVGPRYMQHEMELKFLEDKQYDTPYFEIVFAYNFIQCFIMAPNFAGFDGSFCIATTHLRLKLTLMVRKIHRAFEDARNPLELREKMKVAIRDHQEALNFYNDIQEVYGGWLFVVFMLTSFLISFNLYQIYLIQRIDPKYTIFVISGVMHMYAPCHYASELSEMSINLCDDIYAVPWEKTADNEVTKLLIFIIAKAQQPLVLTGKGIVIYNMELFKSIMQTSYSFFTLITN